jgi:molybdate transport system substrate-binding protein
MMIYGPSISGEEDVKPESKVVFSHTRHSVLGFLIALAALLPASSVWAQATLTVSAAASLKDVIVEAENAYGQSHANVNFANNFGSSGTLAAQIDQGAPVDLFISAASKPMDDLEKKGLIVAGARHNVLRNTLVLIVPLDSKLKDFQGLADRSVRILALGDPASVPAGQYGSQTLAALHLLDTLKSKFVLAKDVRQVLTYVETGNADAGFVYATDAATSGKVRVEAVAPEWTHEAIVYPAAVIKGGHSEEAARRFIECCKSPEAHAIFMKHGFTIAAQ